MDFTKKTIALVNLGEWLEEQLYSDADWISEPQYQNAWFTPENCRIALENIKQYFLKKTALETFLTSYKPAKVPQKVGIILAGNLPAVGFHDLLCLYLSGHQAVVKCSSQDTYLIRRLIHELSLFDESVAGQFIFSDNMKGVDALIATGSDTTARHFDYYFANVPRLLRKNRTSVAVLTGKESSEELVGLGSDILMYFGLGCRNVSKVFVPEGYDFVPFYEAIEPLSAVIHHHKYLNNYEYNKAIYLVNRVPFLDNGFLMLTENTLLHSPISVLYHETYADLDVLAEKLEKNQSSLQCIVGRDIPFGATQKPSLTDFADGEDTMKFLGNL